MTRRYFGTDGVRGVVGEFLTPELVERLGRAAVIWSGAATVFVGRDTRGSGPELEDALARGAASAGANVVLGGVLPTPAVALAGADLGIVISASHNPPEYNGVKFSDRDGHKLPDAAEEQIEALLGAPVPGGLTGTITHRDGESSAAYIDYVIEKFGSDLTGLRVVVDCAHGAYAGLAPEAFARLGATVKAIGDAPDGTNINSGCGATALEALQAAVVEHGFDLGIAFDGDGDRVIAVDELGNVVDGDRLIALMALDLRSRGVLDCDTVVVTSMTNLGFHRAMQRHGVNVVTTEVGDRAVLVAMEEGGFVLGGEQSGHIINLRHATTGDGILAAVLLLDIVRRSGKSLAELAATVMQRMPQLLRNVRVANKPADVEALLGAELVHERKLLGADGRIVVRVSGTEPVVRIMVEAASTEIAEATADRLEQLLVARA